MPVITWTDAPGGSAGHVEGVLVCQLRKLGVGGWSAAWRNGMTWDVGDQIARVVKQSSRHFVRRDRAKKAVEKALAATCANDIAC